MNVYIRQNELQNAYIGGYVEPRTPWANTIAYFPFSSNAIDVTGNNTLTNSWTQDWLWRKFTSASSITTPSWIISYVNYRIKINEYPSGNSAICLSNQKWMGYYPNYSTDARVDKKIFVWYYSDFSAWTVTFRPQTWTWHNISYGYDGTKTIYSIDGIGWTLYNGDGFDFGDEFILSQGNNITISNLILETTARTPLEIATYYNQTKSDYGL